MKAIILAAGMGTRLGSLLPKPLTPLINEKTILDFLVEQLARHIGKENIFIVVGYKKELIMEKFPDLLYVYNDAYAHTNTAKSLLRAFEKIDDDVLWMNGDVYCDDGIIELLLQSKRSASIVDTKKCGDEEIKYTLNADGFIHELSKQVQEGKGESLGINMLVRSDLATVKTELAAVENQDYFEKGLENATMKNSLQLAAIDKKDIFCTEIDFPEDLERARQHIQSQHS